MRKYFIDQPVQWYKDNKLVIGIVIVIISFILGVYGKVLIFAKLYKPLELLTGISVYAFSWILLFIGAFIVGWRTVHAIQARINHEVRKTVKSTYSRARKLPGKAANMTKNLHKRGMDKITSTSKTIVDRMRHQND